MSNTNNYHLRFGFLQSNNFLKVILILFILILVIIFFVLPLKINYSFKVPGKVLAAEEWLIIKSRNGPLITLLKNNISGISKSYSVTEFERGDDAKFIFSSKVVSGGIVSKSDTIGSIMSNELELRLATLRGQLQVTHALLNQSQSGEKTSLINEAKENLEFAIKKVELDKKLFQRQQELHNKKFISDEEFDISKNTLELDEIAISVAKAKLDIVLTGEKKEQIDFIKSQITALESEISVLEEKSLNFHFVSPINGYVNWAQDGDTLLIISDTSTYVVSFPIPLMKKDYVNSISVIKIIHPSGKENVTLTLKRINSTIAYISYKPVVIASGIIHGAKENLSPGLMVFCQVNCGSITISEYIKRIINSEFL